VFSAGPARCWRNNRYVHRFSAAELFADEGRGNRADVPRCVQSRRSGGTSRIFQRSVIFSSQDSPSAGFFLSSGQQSLLDYFARRHEHGETLELTALHIQYREATSEAGLAPTIDRRADDRAPAVITAKGAIDCSDRAIILWNQGGS